MAYNNINKYRMHKKIIEITNSYYDYELTTYKGVWRKFIYPVYPISYGSYMKIINSISDIDAEIAREANKIEEKRENNQLKLEL
ncbi:MAG: hypothetical protein LBK03_04570 [Bacteroidales bacterium]|jgi:hypothetical protein|nr:hypothetical protein [Bacteroidales bacterium]